MLLLVAGHSPRMPTKLARLHNLPDRLYFGVSWFSERCRMELRKGLLCIFLSVLLACRGTLLSQQSSSNAPSGQHLPIGVWESEQPDGSAIGIDLSAEPASVPDAVYPEGTSRSQGSRLQIGVFQRQHKRIACGEENFFITGWTGPGSENGFAVYANRKLEVHYHERASDSEIHVVLVLDPVKDVWTGQFHRKGFDRQSTLHRTSNRPDSAQGGCFLEGPNPPPY
jgi:hypothetical protein